MERDKTEKRELQQEKKKDRCERDKGRVRQRRKLTEERKRNRMTGVKRQGQK